MNSARKVLMQVAARQLESALANLDMQLATKPEHGELTSHCQLPRHPLTGHRLGTLPTIGGSATVTSPSPVSGPTVVP